MAGKESQVISPPPETPGIRVLAKIRIEKDSISIEPAPGGIPIVDLATGKRIEPQDIAEQHVPQKPNESSKSL